MNNKNGLIPSKKTKSIQKSESIEKIIPDDIGEVIEKLDPPDQEKIIGLIKQSSFSFMAPMINPMISAIINKCSPKDFATLIQNMENENVRENKQKELIKKHDFIKFVIGSIVFIFLSVFFTYTKNPELLKEIITYGVLIAGGTGYGIYYIQKKKEEI